MSKNASQADAHYTNAVIAVRSTGRASVAAIQQTLGIRFNHAGELLEQMEADGVVSAMEPNGYRAVLPVSSGQKATSEV